MSQDLAYDSTYMQNPSRHDSTPVWFTAVGVSTNQESNPVEGSLYMDNTGTLQIYHNGSFAPLSGGGGGGAVSSVNGLTGAVSLDQTLIPQVVVKKTANYTITSADDVVIADATSAGFALTLPDATKFNGLLTLVATTTTAHLVTVNTVGGQTMSGSASLTLGTTASGAPYQTLTLVSDKSNWVIV